jgi:ATP-dependent DNA helicase RecQ
MITDILRGSKNDRLLRLGLDKLSTYNISSLSEKRLRNIINHLLLKGYLESTNDEYPTIARGKRAKELLRPDARLEMKLPKDTGDDIRSAQFTKAGAKGGKDAKSVKTVPVNSGLFGRLKTLRAEIAAEQGIPAFIVFSDSSLKDMCMKLPASDNEFLQVSGVGMMKLERYGKRFLSAIAQFGQNPSAGDAARIAGEV